MSKIYTYEEIANHNKPQDSWIAIDGKVYDVSRFVDEHPGGDEIIMDLVGTDATEPFLDIGHSHDALKILKKLYIGDLDKNSTPVVREVPVQTTEASESFQGSGMMASVAAIICFVIGFYLLNE